MGSLFEGVVKVKISLKPSIELDLKVKWPKTISWAILRFPKIENLISSEVIISYDK